MTTYFVTTGISLSNSSRCWKGAERWTEDGVNVDLDARRDHVVLELPQGGAIVRHLRCVRERVCNEVGEDPGTMPSRARTVVEESFRVECWSRDRARLLPAELATLFALRLEMKPGDRVVLPAGQTNRADTYLLQAMIDLLATQGKEGLQGVTTLVTGPYAWEPTSSTAVQEAVKRLFADSRCLRLPMEYVLTGGYKIVLMTLVHQLTLNQVSTRLRYIHEDGDALITVELQEGGIAGIRCDASVFA